MGELSENTAERIFAILGDVRDRGIRTEEHTKAMAVSMARLDHTVHGNGEPGLDERVRNLEANQRRATGAAMKVVQWVMPTALALMAAGALVWIKDSLGLQSPQDKPGRHQAQGEPPE